MNRSNNHHRPWLLLGLCLALSFSLGSGVVEAKKDKPGKCEGTKKQRKQKMDKREITLEQLEQMIAHYKEALIEDRARMRDTLTRRLDRKYDAHQTTGEPFVFDILVISGGGAKGAFGAGFLQTWGNAGTDGMKRPDFDVVTGVSTGALIAPFAFMGTDEAYDSIVEFYANPEPNWVKKRGMFAILPTRVSLFNNCHLQETIRDSVDQSIVAALAAGADEDRLLLIGTTNLDAGSGRVFDLAHEAKMGVESGDLERLHSILIASAALPGVFPPVDIGGMLYADGGATSNLFITAFSKASGPIAQFKKQHPGAALPKIRIWVLVNQQLLPQHAVTQPRWIAVSRRALNTLTSTSQLFALNLIQAMAREAAEDRGYEAEVRYVAIPADAPTKESDQMFDKEYMLALEEFGRRMGADPSNWLTEIPSAYGVENKWLELD